MNVIYPERRGSLRLIAVAYGAANVSAVYWLRQFASNVPPPPVDDTVLNSIQSSPRKPTPEEGID